MDTKSQESMTVEVNTPDGILYLTIIEDNDGSPNKIISTFGKAGTSIAAWAFALDSMINMLLLSEIGINEIIDTLSNITNAKSIKTIKGVQVGSGPEGIAVALLEYKRQKYRRLHDSFD